jgi:hypothetical protein
MVGTGEVSKKTLSLSNATNTICNVLKTLVLLTENRKLKTENGITPHRGSGVTSP